VYITQIKLHIYKFHRDTGPVQLALKDRLNRYIQFDFEAHVTGTHAPKLLVTLRGIARDRLQPLPKSWPTRNNAQNITSHNNKVDGSHS